MPAAPDGRVPGAQAGARLAPPDPHRESRLRGGLQRAAHLVGIVAGWVLFFWGWHTVLARPWDSDSLVLLILGSLVVLPLLTLLWILHNRRIHRIRGPRKTVPAAADDYAHDWNGREVQADWAALADARTIVVHVEGVRKIYRRAGSELPDVAATPVP